MNTVIDNWLAPVRELRAELAKGKNGGEVGMEELIEANVKRSVAMVRSNADVIQAERERGLKVRGLLYDVGTGKLREVDIGEGQEEKGMREKMFGLEL